MWDEDPLLPLSREVKDAVARAADALAEHGANVERIKAPVDTRELLVNYIWLLNSIIGAGFPESVLNEMAKTRDADLKAFATSRDPWSRELSRLAVTAQASEVLAAQRARQALKDRMAAFFVSHDAIVMPITPVTAFKHDHSEPFNARLLDLDGKPLPYPTMLGWIALATALHLPSIAVQAGGQGPACRSASRSSAPRTAKSDCSILRGRSRKSWAGSRRRNGNAMRRRRGDSSCFGRRRHLSSGYRAFRDRRCRGPLLPVRRW